MTHLSNLYRLQVIDSQMDAQQARLAELEQQLSHHPELDAARSEEENARRNQEESRQTLVRAEEENRRQQQKITDAEKTLYSGSVRDPKELQDLQQEIASLRKYQMALEERQLQAMVALEETESATTRAHGKVMEQEEARSAQEKQWQAEKKQWQTQWEKSAMQREAAVVAISPEDLALYQSLRKSKHGLAVTRLESDACSGCGEAPSAAGLDAARSGQEIILCNNCGRILYVG